MMTDVPGNTSERLKAGRALSVLALLLAAFALARVWRGGQELTIGSYQLISVAGLTGVVAVLTFLKTFRSPASVRIGIHLFLVGVMCALASLLLASDPWWSTTLAIAGVTANVAAFAFIMVGWVPLVLRRLQGKDPE